MSVRRRKIAARVLGQEWLLERVLERVSRLSKYLRYVTRKEIQPEPELDA